METVSVRRHGLETRVGGGKLHLVHRRRQPNISLGVQSKRSDQDQRGSIRKRGIYGPKSSFDIVAYVFYFKSYSHGMYLCANNVGH